MQSLVFLYHLQISAVWEFCFLAYFILFYTYSSWLSVALGSALETLFNAICTVLVVLLNQSIIQLINQSMHLFSIRSRVGMEMPLQLQYH